MSEPNAPSPEEAFAALKQLADAFLLGGARPPREAPEDPPDVRRVATLIAGEDGVIRGIDAEAERLIGRASSEVVGSPAASILAMLPSDDKPLFVQLLGSERSVWVTRSSLSLGAELLVLLKLDERDPVGTKRSELRYRHLVEQIPAVVFTGALDGGLYDVYVSPQIESLLGYSQEQWVADPVLWYDRLHPEDRPRLDAEFARGCATGGPFRADCRFYTRENKLVWVHGEARLIKDDRGMPLLLQGVAFDITETKRAEEIARASLREKETLLKEIHHRVKNNLQVTSSLLKLQAERLPDDAAKKALREAQDRIRSMGLVHELLYRSKDLSNVDLGEYIRDLTRQLLRSHTAGSNVVVESKLVPVPLPIDLAVPCGLILNELVSNALKHAFPGGRAGLITIELRSHEDGSDLIVRDDGVGMPADAFKSGSTLGLQLIQTLAAQVNGELEVKSGDGTEVRLKIPRRGATRT